ncbi:MAG: C39 family peptidase [Anaerolineae bacterium]|nr:C39 family peptidase [Anaerolineae bacterium]
MYGTGSGMRVIQGLCGLAVAFSLAGCGRLQALIDPPTPRPPAPTDFAPAVTPDLARVAEVFEPTETPTPPPAVATEEPLPRSTLAIVPTDAPRATPAPTRPPLPTRTPVPAPTYVPLKTALLRGFRYERQTFNNCGPATTATLLSYFGRAENQTQVASVMRPNKDDKNVSPGEIVDFAVSLGFGARVVIGADLAMLRGLVSNGLPVIVESWLIPTPNDEMGHYILLKGYEDDTLVFDDSFHGENLREESSTFDARWKVFNRTVIVVWKAEQAGLARRLLGARADDRAMRDLALAAARADIDANPQDKFAWFNAGSTLVQMGEYTRAARAFDTARGLRLPWRMLWYQFGPYEAYFGAREYGTLVQLATQTLSTTNGLEESHLWRGRAYLAQGKAVDARVEFEAALKDNPNFAPARDALKALGG